MTKQKFWNSPAKMVASLAAIFFLAIIGWHGLSQARENNTWPFNTNFGYYVPNPVKQVVYSVLTPAQKVTTTYLYNLKIRLFQIPNYQYLGYGGAVNPYSDGLLYTTNSGKNFFFDEKSETFKDLKAQFPKFDSVRDVVIHDKKIYVLGVKQSRSKCSRIAVDQARIRQEESNLFELASLHARWESEENCSFNTKTSGGRIVLLKDTIYLSTGIFQSPIRSGIIPENWSQLDKSSFGKIIKIQGNKSSVYAKGFRNPQGLFLLNDRQTLFNTDHGPSGGDEVNIITENQNYGWPCSSRGKLYGTPLNALNIYPSIEDLNFYCKESVYEQPLFYFSEPSIGISQGLQYTGRHFKLFKDDIIISSLKGKSLFRMKYNKEKKSIESVETIYVGFRVRDLVELRNGKLGFITDKGFLGIIEIAENLET